MYKHEERRKTGLGSGEEDKGTKKQTKKRVNAGCGWS